MVEANDGEQLQWVTAAWIGQIPVLYDVQSGQNLGDHAMDINHAW